MTSPESDILAETNAIKENLSVDILTPEQKAVYDEICQMVAEEERRINLFGPSGVGKTVLCWVLAKVEDWQYLSDRDLDPDQPSVIFDHGDPSRRATRRIRAKMELNNLSRVIYVTRKSAEEFYPQIELDPDPDHQDKIKQRLADLE